jgi:nitrite reductase/ring-hydroxylating ferredoxin subunit
MSWIKVCPADIDVGECKGVAADGVAVAIYNVDGTLHATSNICTHQHALLSEGYLEGEFIECPLHQGRFNVVTGETDGGPVTEPVRVYPIRIEGGEVFVDVGSCVAQITRHMPPSTPIDEPVM